MIRCLICGSSKVDLEFAKCALCGAAAGLRDEQCYVADETRNALRSHAEELSAFGVKLEERKIVRKGVDAVGAIALALAVADSLDSGVLRKLVVYLRGLKIPQDEILCLRLAEPEAATDILDGEEECNRTAQQ